MSKRQRLDYDALTTKLDPYLQQEVLSFIPTLAQVMEPILLRRYHGVDWVLEDVEIHQDDPFDFRVTGKVSYWMGCQGNCPGGGYDGVMEDDCYCGHVKDDINDRFVVGTRERLLSLPLIWPSMQRDTVFPVSGFYEGLYWAMVVGGQRV